MKKINLKGISEILSEKELKNVMGGSDDGDGCKGCSSGEWCTKDGQSVRCSFGGPKRMCGCW